MQTRSFAIAGIGHWTSGFVTSAAIAAAASAEVRLIDEAGNGSFTEIQAAIDASVDGDTLLVNPGIYAGFTVDQKAVWILATVDDAVTISDTVRIENLTSTQSVVLYGLSVEVDWSPGSPAQVPALDLSNNAGHVRARNCSFTGADGVHLPSTFSNGGPGASIASCLSVAFTECTFVGGDADTSCIEDLFEVVCNGLFGRGGHGVSTTLSISAFYDCTLTGGKGGEVAFEGDAGTGGSGVDVPTFAIFASGSRFQGGVGGRDISGKGGTGGNGGDGVRVAPGARVFLLDNQYTSGAGGTSAFGIPGSAGAQIAGGGIVNTLGGVRRLCSVSELVPAGGEIAVHLRGEPGDRVYLPMAILPHWQYAARKYGVWFIPPPPKFSHAPIAILPPSGTAIVNVHAPGILPTDSTRRVFAQPVFFSTQGQTVLGGPLHFTVVNCAAATPDCNSNSSSDLCDVVGGASNDCNVNLMPDECEADCNGNAIPDSCDISSRTSEDLNGNGVPDECEPANAVWYVDAAAAPGGDGSSAFPFRTVSEGVNIALSGHIVRVRDGVYTGAGNRAMDFSNRILRVESENGPANCIIDLQSQGHAFKFGPHASNQAATITGFTIRNGLSTGPTFVAAGAIDIGSSSPTIENCVFENCEGRAGAISAHLSGSTIRGCTFVGNHGVRGANHAGAVYLRPPSAGGSQPSIVDCAFVDNTSDEDAGAVRILSSSSDRSPRVSHCVFLGNSAQRHGGAIASSRSSVGTFMPGVIEHCLFVGNESQGVNNGVGGAVGALYDVLVRDCTFVGNSATVGGGFGGRGPVMGLVENCVIWGNTAASGAQLSISSTGDANQLTVRYCDVQGGQPAIFVGALSTLVYGAGNLTSDPLFVDGDGPDNDALTLGDNDYRLSASSPCIDAGDTSVLPLDVLDLDADLVTSEFVPFDLDFGPRRVDDPGVPDTGVGPAPVVDIGAYERP